MVTSHELTSVTVKKGVGTVIVTLKTAPFDRDDVHELAEMMDTFLDRIDDSANIILTRRFTEVDEDLTTMTDNIMFAAESLGTIIRNLKFMGTGKAKEIMRLCQEIKTIEHDNDELYGNYLEYWDVLEDGHSYRMELDVYPKKGHAAPAPPHALDAWGGDNNKH